jgi:outer membrane protein assembly factor BamB
MQRQHFFSHHTSARRTKLPDWTPRCVASSGALLVAFAAVLPLVMSPSDASASRILAPTNWTTYHANSLETGIAPAKARFTRPTMAWTSPSLDGQLYGEPLVDGGLVVVATENDTVYALAATTGAVVWSTTVGTAVPSGNLPCGNISPTVGITGTPVIDPARGEVFAFTDEAAGSSAQHYLVGLDLSTGAVLLHQAISLPGSDQLAQLQRTGLALDDGNVVAGLGGNAGDCGNYHGWVISVPEGGGLEQSFQVSSGPGDSQGAIWMGGAAPVVDSQGNVWVATGNGAYTSGPSPDASDSVVELTSALAPVQSFTPSTWQTDNADDLDLGSSPPAIMGNGYVLQIGKSQTAFLLNASNLAGVGGQVAQLGSVCGNDVDGGQAFTSSVVYEPCVNGVMAVKVRPQNKKHPLHVLWTTSTGSTGPPIVAGNEIWTISQDGTLYGLRKSNGRAAVQLALPSAPANHFPTPAVGAGLLLAPAYDQVVAFQ